MIDPYDPEGFRAAGHAVIDQLADYLAGTGRSDGPVLDYSGPRATLERWATRGDGSPRVPFAELLPTVIAD